MNKMIVATVVALFCFLSLNYVIADQETKDDDQVETSFEGFVIDQETKEPVKGAWVTVYDGSFLRGDTVYTDGSGYYYTEFKAGGTFYLYAESVDHYQQSYSCMVETGERSEYDFELESKSNITRVYGTISDKKTGDAIPHVWVTLLVKIPKPGPFIGYTETEWEISNREGFYSIQASQEGEYKIEFETEDYYRYKSEESFYMKIGDEIELNVELDPWDQGVYGVVEDSSGAPVDDVVVTVENPFGVFTCDTDEDGNFEIKIPTSSKFTIRVHEEGYRPHSGVVSVRNNEMTEVMITLEDAILPPMIQKVVLFILQLITNI